MNLDEETLMEIEDYIKHLDEKIGLKAETMLDVEKAINRCRSELKNLHKANVIKSVCEEHEWKYSNDGEVKYCTKCDEREWA